MFTRIARATLCMLAVSVLAVSGTMAQDQILQKIPANAVGFLVVNNVSNLTSRLDQWFQTVGLGPIVQNQMPQGSLEALKACAMLGEGFDPNASFAVVMLDPLAYGVKLPGAVEETQPAEEPQEQKWPVVVMVAGSSVEAVFSAYQVVPEGPYAKVQLPMGEVFAKQQDGYVLLSPLAAALEAVAQAANPISVSLGDKHRRLIAESQIALHVNMDVAQPIVDTLIAMFERKMQEAAESGMGPPPAMIASWSATAKFYRNLLRQAQSATAGGQFADAGLLVHKLVSFRSDSPLQKILAVYPKTAGPLLDRVPNNQYLLAMGVACPQGSPELQEFQQTLTAQMLGLPMFEGLSDEQKAQFQDAVRKLNQQVQQVQFVVGGVPGPGVFGLAEIVMVQDAQQVRQAVMQILPIYQQMFSSTAGAGKMEGLTIRLAEPGLTVDNKPVDVIQINQPEMDEEIASSPDFEQFMGQKQLEIYMATPADNVVVLTMGGGTEFLSQVMTTAAQASNPFATTEGVQQVMGRLPPNRFLVGLFSLSGMFDLMQRIGNVVSPGARLPFELQSAVPLAMGLGAEDDGALRASLYVPNEMVQSIANIVSQARMGMGGPPTTQEGQEPGEPPQEDF